MVGQVLEAGLDAPIVFAGDEHEGVGRLDLARQRLERRRGLALGIFLVHPVEHRQVERLRIDQFGRGAALRKGADEVIGEADALPVGPVRAVEDQDGVAHAGSLLLSVGATDQTGRYVPARAGTR